MDRINRNDPCPCGSGKKYKKCCLVGPPPLIPDPDDVLQIHAQALKSMGDQNWQEAISLFRSIEHRIADRLALFQQLGACFDAAEDFLRAAEYYEKALAVDSSNRSNRFQLNYRLGVARACGNRFEEAQEAFRTCLSFLEPGEASVSENLKNLIDTLEAMKLGEAPPHLMLVNVLLQRAMSDMEDERYEQAAERLERLTALDGENATIFYNLGVVYTFLKKEPEAMLQYERALQLNPYYVQAWYNMGQICLIKNKDYSRALSCFDRALALRPDYVGAHHQRGVAWELIGDYSRALECWRKTLELDPQNELAKSNIERVNQAISHSFAETITRKDPINE
ncbi:MAG: tetratricopeptide repeat protein [Desulfomonile sp.]|nr:tetratricopeptide repeat protein [Desulfomonile sp.]